MSDHDPVSALTEFPLLDAVFGRRSRRFGAGMRIPDGPLAHTSNQPALLLDDREIAVLTAMACGSIGWHEGIPHRDGDAGLASYAFRFTGRASPGGAGIGTGELIYTNDSGTYIVRTRDIKPIDAELTGGGAHRGPDSTGRRQHRAFVSVACADPACSAAHA
jgi:hypothetical protein